MSGIHSVFDFACKIKINIKDWIPDNRLSGMTPEKDGDESLIQEGRTTQQFLLSLSLSLFLFLSLSLSLSLFLFLSLFLSLSLFLFLFSPQPLIPSSEKRGGVPERHVGSSQLSKCLVVDFDFGFDLVFAFVVGGGPRWARYEKSCFLYSKIPHFRLFEA